MTPLRPLRLRRTPPGCDTFGLLAPGLRTVKDDALGERARVLSCFKVVKVFDISQTDPIPGVELLPERPRPRPLRGDSEAARALGQVLLALCESEGVAVSADDVEFDERSPGANGVYL